MIPIPQFEIWFAVGSQHLYGPKTLEQVSQDAKEMVKGLNASGKIPFPIVFHQVLTTSEAIVNFCEKASNSPHCAGVIGWMHTFSPAKMWIHGLSALQRPFLHLHTQFGRDIPWNTIDMDFMNLNQSAHGDREFGHIAERLGVKRSVVAGFWKDSQVQTRMGTWARAAGAVTEGRRAKFARFGDNMREVAVTDGDKVSAQMKFGWSVNAYGVGGLAHLVAEVDEKEARDLVASYKERYEISSSVLENEKTLRGLTYQAKIEIALRSFLEEGGFKGFTTNFEDLYGLEQLPGLAVQNLMAEGYGFGAEGDWKTAALVRAMKLMAHGLPGGTSFMEDYTYHMEPGNELVLGAHMLEVCPSIAAQKPKLEIHPLGIGGKNDPARLVFDAAPGEALNASLIDLGDRFRLIVNEVKTVSPPSVLPRLPVAHAVWQPHPDFTTGLEGWIWAGGAHHTGYTTALTSAHMQAWADLVGVEFVRIGKGSTLEGVRQELNFHNLLAQGGRPR